MSARFREVFAIALLLAVSLGVIHRDMIFSGFAFTQGGAGDSLLLNYVAEHEYLWLIHAPLHEKFLSPPILYPLPNTAAYSDLFLAALPIYAPARAAGADPQTAFQVWFLIVSALNLLSAYLLLRHVLGFGIWGSAGGALLFAFGAPRLASISHPQLWIGFLLISAYAGLHWTLSGERMRAGLFVLGVAAAAQLYTAFYYAWFMAFCGTIALIYAAAVQQYRSTLLAFLRRSWVWCLAAFTVLIALCIPAILAYSAVLGELGVRQYSEVANFLPNLRAWFAQGPEHPIYGWLNALAGIGPQYRDHELLNGIGLLTSALVIAAWVRLRIRPDLKIWGVVALSIVLLTLALPGGLSLWRLVYAVFPGAQAIRAVSRFALFLLLPASIALAAGLDEVARRYGPAIVALCLCAVSAEQAGSLGGPEHYAKQSVRTSIDTVMRQSRPDCDALFATFRTDQTSIPIMHVFGMWAGLLSGVPSLNGYTGQLPKDWPLADVSVSNRLDYVRLLRSLRIWMEAHPVQLSNVCWADSGQSEPLRLTMADLSDRTWPAAVAYVDLMGRAAKPSTLFGAEDWDGPAFVKRTIASPAFQEHERFVFEEYRRLMGRNPTYADWLDPVSKLDNGVEYAGNIVERWHKSPECSSPDCRFPWSPKPGFTSGENKECPSAVLYYCLLRRAPSPAEELEDLNAAIPHILSNEAFQAQLRIP